MVDAHNKPYVKWVLPGGLDLLIAALGARAEKQIPIPIPIPLNVVLTTGASASITAPLPLGGLILGLAGMRLFRKSPMTGHPA